MNPTPSRGCPSMCVLTSVTLVTSASLVLLVALTPSSRAQNSPTDLGLRAAPTTTLPHSSSPSATPTTSPNTTSPNTSSEPSPTVAPPAPSTDAIRNIAPDIYYLPDSRGQLVPIPLDMTFEEFADLYDLKHGLTKTAPLPEFTIEQLVGAGNVVNHRVDLDLLLSIRTLRNGWVRVPLELGRAITREPITWPKATDVIVTFDQDRRGYVAWLRAGEQGLVNLPLKVSFAVNQTGGETRLEIDLPRATNSVITLTIDRNDLSARVSEGARLLPHEASANGGTTFRVEGAHGPCEIAWRPKASRSVEASSLVEVQGELRVNVRGIDAVTTDAQFRARSYGRPLEALRIRLPQNMTLASGDQPKYTVAVLEAEPGEGADPVGALVEVKMRQPTNDPVDIRLITEWTRPAERDRAPLEVADFQVLEAVRHHGHIALIAEGEWLLNWEPGTNVRRVVDLPDGLATENLVAGFAYDRQPCSLPIRIDRKKTYLNVEPSFRFDVAADRVEMLGEFLINVRGAPAAQLNLHLPGWQVEEVSAEGIVKSDELELDQVDPLRIPLVRPISGRMKLTVRAVRLLEKGLSQLHLDIPHLTRTSSSPALLIVVPADNVALQSREDVDTYLTPEELPEDSQFSQQQQHPLAYRYRGPADQAHLEYNFSLKPRSITCDVSTNVNLNPTHAVVRQTLHYMIRNEPLGELRLRSVATIPEQQLTVRLGGRKQSLSADDSFITDPLERGFRLTLPQPLTGPVDLEVNIPVDGWEVDQKDDGTAELSIPLIMPADGQLETNRISMVAVPDVALTWNDDRWQRETGVTGGESVLTSEQRITGMDLTIGAVASTRRSPTIVERAFFQTWLTTNKRQDRAVYKLVTESPQLRITPPSGVLADQIQILVNGQLTEPYRENNGVLVVDNPAVGGMATVHLEMVTAFSSRPPRGGFAVVLPRIEGVAHIQKYFWHLVTPSDEHLLSAPEQVTREEFWSWRGWRWGRRIRLSQTALETWSGGSHQLPPANANNEYLMSSFGVPHTFSIRTVTRRVALSLAGSGVLFAGLALMFVPTLRHPAILLALAVGILVFGAWQPQLALLAAQLGGATIILLVVAKLLDWITIQRRPMFVPARPTRGATESGSTRVMQPPKLEDHESTMASSSVGSGWSHLSSNDLEQ